MLWFGSVAGVLAGLAGHGTDSIFRKMENGRTPGTWILLSRYGVGFLIVWLIFSLFVSRRHWRDEASRTLLMSGVTVGLGVAIGHYLDDMREQG